MSYSDRWRLAVALKQGYPDALEAGALEVVPGSSPPAFIDRQGLWPSAEDKAAIRNDPQRKADFALGAKRGLFGAGVVLAMAGAGYAIIKRK
jgi:hypothetical protein